jgi:hypothetical protein
MHGEFLRLLFIIAHRRTECWFTTRGVGPGRFGGEMAQHSEDAFTFRRDQRFLLGQEAMPAFSLTKALVELIQSSYKK